MIFRKAKNSEDSILKGCIKRKQSAQKELYELYFNYAMSIALRYASGRDEAIEIVNDGFIKVFDAIERYDPNQPFKAWFRQIIVYTSIDHYRKNAKHQHDSLDDHLYIDVQVSETVMDNFNEDDIMRCVQELPPSYRTVFVMYVVEGYKHHEIASLLKISEGTSKSNLAMARERLKKMLLKNTHNQKQHG